MEVVKMGMLAKNKMNEEDSKIYNDYFDFGLDKKYEKIFITDNLKVLNGSNITIIGFKDLSLNKKLKQLGFKEINYIDEKVANYIALNKIEKADILYLKDNFELIDEFKLADVIKNYKNVIISSDSFILISLGLINNTNYENDIMIDKYGIILKINA